MLGGKNIPAACAVIYSTALSQNGLHAAAEKILRFTIASLETSKEFGTKDVEIGLSTLLGNLAITVYSQNRPAESIPIYHQALTLLERIVGKSHFDTVWTQMNLANALRYTGKLDEAIAAIEKEVADLTQLVGTVHPATLEATRKLAIMDLGGIASIKAWHICKGLLKLTTLSLGVDHLETKATLDIVDSVVLIINSADYETSTLKPGKTKERDAAAWTSLKEVPASTLKKLCCGNTDCPWRTLPLNLGQPKKQPTWQCMQCKLVFYCDRDCQKTHWKDQGHKAECTPAW